MDAHMQGGKLGDNYTTRGREMTGELTRMDRSQEQEPVREEDERRELRV
jgi:hypothetical protein